jgi:hypothetical protein
VGGVIIFILRGAGCKPECSIITKAYPLSESTAGSPEDSARRKGDRSLLGTQGVPAILIPAGGLWHGSTGRSTQLSYFMVTLTRGMGDSFENTAIAESPSGSPVDCIAQLYFPLDHVKNKEDRVEFYRDFPDIV